MNIKSGHFPVNVKCH